MKSRTLLVSTLLTAACASGTGAPPRDAASEQKLVKALAHWDEQTKQFEAKDAKFKKQCEIKADDCLLVAGQKRDDLIFGNSSPLCRAKPDSESEARCIADELMKKGQAAPAADYYAYSNGCYERMLTCTAELEGKAAEAARLARREERRNQILGLHEALASVSAVEFAKKRVEYVRSTLPPKLDGSCKELPEVPSCEARVEHQEEAFEAELDAEQGAFSQERALSLFQRARATESGCYDPELACLAEAVRPYGVTYKTEQLLARNFDALKTREQLLSHMTAGTAKQCVDGQQHSHAKRIIESYQIYAKQPVMFFRSRLHRAFLTMHQAQVACLKSAAGPELTAAATGTKLRKRGKKKDCGDSRAC